MKRQPLPTVALLLAPLLAAVLLYGCRDVVKPTALDHSRTPVPAAAVGSAAAVGLWTAPFSWPTVAIHLHLLPTGKVLSWSTGGEPIVWNPATRAFTRRARGTNVFCAGHAFLADGRLLVTGGHINKDRGLPDANIFDPQTETWTPVADMERGRWYPTSTTLPNGELLTIAGADENAATVSIPEVWRVGGGWRKLTTAGRDLPYYPRMFVAPNGHVFYAGELRATGYLNTSGTGAWTFVGNRRYAARDYGSAVMYEPGKVLYAGGGDPPTRTAEIIDLNVASPAWRYTGSMAYARRQINATILADGKVLVTGGTSAPGFNNLVGAVHAAELWDPATGRWTTLASNQIIRGYHATTILLPDARVLHAGSGGGENGGPRERNAEIFSPPYLFRADGSTAPRPVISGAPSRVGYGQSFSVSTPNAAVISQVTLARLGSATHAFDQNQRFNRLAFTRTTGGLSVTAPASRNRAPPGHYMLFILDSSGVPSVATIIRIG